MKSKNKSALICGISGQDGSYLAQFLIKKDYTVIGTSRDHRLGSFQNLKILAIDKRLSLITLDPKDFHNVLTVLKKFKPDEIYYLAGQSSVGLSFDLPGETLESITMGTLNMLEACRMLDYPVRFYHAGSSECFGETGGKPADEDTPFSPKSPYAIAKASAFWLVKNYRDSYNLFASTGICFNHESPLRPERFVTQKIISSAKRIAAGSNEKLEMGNIKISRDWGWAPEYVEAMWLMLQQKNPIDYVIGTGESHTLTEFIENAFLIKNLDWKDYVFVDEKKNRPNDILYNASNPSLIRDNIGWVAKTTFYDVIKRLIG